MGKFEPYPIYVNFADRWELARIRQGAIFAMKDDEKMVNWLNATGAELYQIMEDKTPSFEARDYEYRVYQLLRLIASTRIGKCLFDSLDRKFKYWILPTAYPNAKPCNCGAHQFPGTPKGGGGERVWFEPRDWHGSAVKFASADDVLFHEMVHAYRDAEVGYSSLVRFGFEGYRGDGDTGAEEFFAVQMQNVYLSNRGGRHFYRSYDERVGESKEEVYERLCNETALGVLRYFLDSDPLAKEVAKWTNPSDSYNIWRDLPMLEQAYLRRRPALKRIPPFVPPARKG